MAIQLVGRTDVDNIREVWPDEETDFTPWLRDNLEDLANTLGLGTLEPVSVETVGDYRPDLVAKDEEGDLIVIENQLTQTNHDHLGKLLVYMADQNATVGIWISADARTEHKRTVEFINSYTGLDFALYLVEIRAFRIGDGPYTWLFQPVASPSQEVKKAGRVRDDAVSTLRKQNWKAREDFLRMAVDKIRAKAHMFMNVNPSEPNQWVGEGLKIGKGGLSWNMVVTNDRCRAELWLGHGNPEVNVERHNFLLQNKEAIEKAFGGDLTWEETKGKGRTVRAYVEGGLKDTERWPAITDELTDKMKNLATALNPYFSRLP